MYHLELENAGSLVKVVIHNAIWKLNFLQPYMYREMISTLKQRGLGLEILDLVLVLKPAVLVWVSVSSSGSWEFALIYVKLKKWSK